MATHRTNVRRRVGAAERLEDRRLMAVTDWGGLDQGVQTQGYVGWFDPQDSFSFELQSPRQVDLALTGLSGDADLYLVDRNGELVAQSRASGRQNERIREELEPGIYRAIVSRYGFSSTNYRLSAQSASVPLPQPADHAGNQFANARELGTLSAQTRLQDSVGSQDTADLYRFRVDRAGAWQIGLSGLAADANVSLFTSDQRTIARSWQLGSTPESLTAQLTPGSYFVGVYSANGTKITPYQLELKPGNTAENPPIAVPPRTTPATPSTPATPIPTTPSTGNPLAAVDYYGGTQDWNVNSVQAPEAWGAGYTGQGIVVAVVDTGVQINHPDLQSQIWQNVDEILGDGIDNDRNGYIDDRFGWDFISRDNQPTDANGHGTHVAGTIAAARNNFGATGIAYGARIMPVRVLDQSGSGSSLGVANGIRYAVDNGADIINLSLGGSFSVDIESAMQYARQKDVLIVSASGNESSGVPSYPARHSASMSNVLSVGAYGNTNQLASFSNRVGNSGAVQIDGPGVGIYSTVLNSRYSTLSGTSMATPHVAGVAALILSANPQLTSVELRSLLAGGSDRNAISGSDSIGKLNAATSIGRALASLA